MSIPSHVNILSIRPYVQRLASFRPKNGTSDPEFELIVRRHSYIREVSLDGALSRPSFVSRHKRSVIFLLHDQSDVAVRMALSFSEYDLYPTCGSEILSFVRETIEGGKLKVVVDISCVTEYQINDEELDVALVEARSDEEERSRKRWKVAPAKTVLEEREWEGGDGEGGTCICTVCLEEFGVGEKVVRMPCSHFFHKECIRKWLTEESNSCPLCRLEIE